MRWLPLLGVSLRRAGGEGTRCLAKNQPPADEAEPGAQRCLTLHHHTAKEQTWQRHRASSGRAVLLIISIGFTVGLATFLLNMSISPQTREHYFSSRALAEPAQKQVKHRWRSLSTSEFPWVVTLLLQDTTAEEEHEATQGEGHCQVSVGTSQEPFSMHGEKGMKRLRENQPIGNPAASSHRQFLSPFCATLIPKIINAIFHSLAHVFFLQQAINRSVVSLKPLTVIPFQRLSAGGEYLSQAEVAKFTFSSNP